MWRRQVCKLLRKTWLLHRQVAQYIDKECLLAGIVAVEGFLRGNTSLCQNGINARRLIPLLEKESMGGGAKPLACLLGACVLSVFHCHSSLHRTVLYGTIIVKRKTMVVKSQSVTLPSQHYVGKMDGIEENTRCLRNE